MDSTRQPSDAWMRDKTVLITGGNDGMGFETALALSAMGATTLIVSRDPARGEAARRRIVERGGNERVQVFGADLARLASVRTLAMEVARQHPRLDVLVNNAGVFEGSRTVTEDGFETMVAVNHLAPFLLTNLLRDTLLASAPARVVNINSGTSRLRPLAKIGWDDLQGERSFGSFRSYAQSKFAGLLFTYELARRLHGTGVTVNAVDPGSAKTKPTFPPDQRQPLLSRPQAALVFADAATAARTAVYAASSPKVEGVTGAYFAKGKQRRTVGSSYDETLAERMWELSAELTGVGGIPSLRVPRAESGLTIAL